MYAKQHTWIEPDCPYPGIAVKVFHHSTRAAGLTYELVDSTAGDFGGLIDEENNIWDGWLGLIQNGTIFTALADFTVTADQSNAFDFRQVYL